MAKNTDCALEIERLRGIIAQVGEPSMDEKLEQWDEWYKTLPSTLKAKLSISDFRRLGDNFYRIFVLEKAAAQVPSKHVEEMPSAKFNPVSIIGPIEQGHAANELPQPLTDTPPKSLTDMPPTHSHIRALTNGTIERCAQVTENWGLGRVNQTVKDYPATCAAAIAYAIRKLKDADQ